LTNGNEALERKGRLHAIELISLTSAGEEDDVAYICVGVCVHLHNGGASCFHCAITTVVVERYSYISACPFLFVVSTSFFVSHTRNDHFLLSFAYVHNSSGRAKAYMEVAWALCIPSLDYVTVFHKCQNRAKDYPSEDVALARTFFEGARGNMYPHVGDSAMLI